MANFARFVLAPFVSRLGHEELLPPTHRALNKGFQACRYGRPSRQRARPTLGVFVAKLVSQNKRRVGSVVGQFLCFQYFL
jgi:hypothetical protein